MSCAKSREKHVGGLFLLDPLQDKNQTRRGKMDFSAARRSDFHLGRESKLLMVLQVQRDSVLSPFHTSETSLFAAMQALS